MKVLLISPYHGGSHAAWANGYQKFSRHQIRLLTLPARYWKWRMHGGAITLARKFVQEWIFSGTESDLNISEPFISPKVIIATDMLDLTTFLALTRRSIEPCRTILYMHENQLTYPLPDDGETGPMRRQKGERDLHYAFINLASMVAADLILFNSKFHMTEWFDQAEPFLKHFPEYNELDLIPLLKAKCEVLPLGIDLFRLNQQISVQRPGNPPLIIWNHRWEYDKNPAQFFEVLIKIAAEGVAFRLAVCGENFSNQPAEFAEAHNILSKHIIHWGYADPAHYRQLLWQADIIVSTAFHEFFGISVLEAIYCRTFPILPNRLSYPELILPELHHLCFYENNLDLTNKLSALLNDPSPLPQLWPILSNHVAKYDWSSMAPIYDARLDQLVTQNL